MSRFYKSCLLIAALLFSSGEAALDRVTGDHSQRQQVAQSLTEATLADGGDLAAPAGILLDGTTSDGTPADGDLSGHCQHCCHGHASSLPGQAGLFTLDSTDQRCWFYRASFTQHSQAPPTPPPNA